MLVRKVFKVKFHKKFVTTELDQVVTRLLKSLSSDYELSPSLRTFLHQVIFHIVTTTSCTHVTRLQYPLDRLFLNLSSMRIGDIIHVGS